MFIERRFDRVVESIMLVVEDWISAHIVYQSDLGLVGPTKRF
jgi:hypothetical protein